MMSETKDLTTMLHPGEQLRLKRIEFGLDIEDVANELFLSKIQLKALEKGDYANLPGPTYVVGYWRNYANLLDFDLSEAIDHHRKNLKTTDSGIVLSPNHQQAHGHQEKARKNSAFLFLFLSVIFLGVIWFWQHPEDNPLNQWVHNMESKQLGTVSESEQNQVTGNSNPDSSDQIVQLENQSSQQEQGLVNLSEQIVVEEIHPEPNFSEEFEQNLNQAGQEAVVQEAVVQEAVVQEAVVQEAVVQEAVVQEAVVQEAVVQEQAVEENSLPTVEPVVEVQPVVESDSEVDSQLEPVVAAPEATVLVTPVENESVVIEEAVQSAEVTEVVYSPNQIVLRVNLQTWLDVRDQSGEKLAYKTVRKGEVLTLNGSPPFSVFIGSASGVSVEYLGVPVEFEPHKSGLFARFQVGEAQ